MSVVPSMGAQYIARRRHYPRIGRDGRGVSRARRQAQSRNRAESPALPQQRPSVIGRPLEAFEQPARPFNPPAADSWFAAIVDVIDGQRGRHASRRSPIAALAVQRIRALASCKRCRRSIEPPLGPAEPLERLGRLARAKRRVELPSRLAPRSLTKCCLARPHRTFSRFASTDSSEVML